LVQWGIRAIPLGIAAMLLGYVLNSEGTQPDPADAGSVSSGVSVFGTIHPDIFRFRAPLGSAPGRARLELASLSPQIASDADDELDLLSETSSLPCGNAWLDEPAESLNSRVAFFDKPIGSADGCPASFDDRFASATPVRAGTFQTASIESASDLKLQNGQSEAPKPPVSIARVRPGPPRRDLVAPVDDGRTAIYDISARTVYLPNGKRLEAHSGLGSMMDNPRYVNTRMRGSTPPNIYNLTLRERMFHGVRAIRLNPVDEGRMYGRAGILAHTYMLGSNGQSNGCVSFSNYPEFLNAYLKGEITRLAVVERLESPPGRLAAGQLPPSVKELLKATSRSTQYAAAADR
jgi:Tlde1 domain